MKNILNSLLTILSMITFFITSLIVIIIFNISYFFSADNITKGVLEMDVTKAINEIENSNAGGMTITEVLDNAYIVAEYYGVSSKVIDEMVEDKDIKEFFGKTAGNVTDYIINNESNPILTSEEFNIILDNNIDIWIKESKVTVTEKQKKDFLDTVKKESGQIIDNFPTSQVIAKKLGTTRLDTIQKIFNDKTKMLIIAILLISLLLIIILKRKEHRNIVYIGDATLILGIITIGIGLISSDLITIILSKTGVFLVDNVFSNMLMRQFIITGIIDIIISIILYILHLILKRIKRR